MGPPCKRDMDVLMQIEERDESVDLHKGRLTKELPVVFSRSWAVIPFSRRNSQTSGCRNKSHKLQQREFHFLRKSAMAIELYQSAKRLWIILPCGFLEFS